MSPTPEERRRYRFLAIGVGVTAIPLGIIGFDWINRPGMEAPGIAALAVAVIDIAMAYVFYWRSVRD